MRLRLPYFLLVTLIALVLPACVAHTATRTVHVRSDGTQSVGVRSASDGVPGESGPQEILGFYLPFGPFAIKSALLWDGTTWVPPIGGLAAQSYAADPCGCAPQTIEVPETVMVPQTQMVPQTRMVRRAVIPLPEALPNPCAPPQRFAVDPCAPQVQRFSDPCAPAPTQRLLRPQVVPAPQPQTTEPPAPKPGSEPVSTSRACPPDVALPPPPPPTNESAEVAGSIECAGGNCRRP